MKYDLTRGLARIAVVALLATACPAIAQDEGEEKDENVERMEQETANLTARTNLVNAQKAYIEALPLPGFENTTTLEGEGAGSLEATILSAEALGHAAKAIANDVGTGNEIVLLTADEQVDLTLAHIFEREIDHIGKVLDAAGEASKAAPGEAGLSGGGLGVAGALSLVTELAGLFGNETTLSYLDTGDVDDAMLVTAIADQLGDNSKVYLPSAVFGIGEAGGDLLADYDELQDAVPAATARRNALAGKKPAKRTKNEQAELELLNQAVNRFTLLSTKATTATEEGDLPIHQAAKALSAYADGRKVLRVGVAKAGGSLVNSKNIGTFFGADPLRITGGVVVSYRMFDPSSGEIHKAGVLHCATAKTSLRQLHRRKYRVADKPCGEAS